MSSRERVSLQWTTYLFPIASAIRKSETYSAWQQIWKTNDKFGWHVMQLL